MSVKIFLSTVSDEFRRYRDLLRSDLTRHNVEVKVQEDFKDLGGETLDKLDVYIANCDAVVHLIGDMTGAYPGERGSSALLAKYPDLPAKLAPLGAALKDGVGVSYTQWEAWLALYHDKLLLIAEAAETAERESKDRPTADARTAQATHLARLKMVGRYSGCTFTSPDSLAKYVLGGAILDLLVQAYAEEGIPADQWRSGRAAAELAGRKGGHGLEASSVPAGPPAAGEVAGRLAAAAAAPGFAGKLRAFLDEYLVSEEGPGEVPFGGRDPELVCLDCWLADEKGPARSVLAAPAGRGKSALLVQWIRRLEKAGRIGEGPGQWRLAFVPISMRFGTNRPEVFYGGLAARLAEITGELIEQPRTEPVAFYEEQCRILLDVAIARELRVLLVIDGADEASGESFGVSWFPRAPGPHVRVLVSGRLQIGDRDAQGWIGRLGWVTGFRTVPFGLPPLLKEGIEDLLRRAGAPVDVLAARPEITRRLLELTEGEPLLLRLYVEGLWKHGDAAGHLTLDDLARIEPGFGGFFEDWLTRQRKAWADEDVKVSEEVLNAHLAVLACAHGRLAADELAELVRRAHGVAPSLRTEGVLHPIRRFVIGAGRHSGGADAGYVLSHPKLGDYLREEYFDRRAVVQTRRTFADWGLEVVEQANGRSLESHDVPPYLLHHLSQHLKDVDAPPSAFMSLVEEGWLRAWEALEGGYRGFSQDVRRAADAVLAWRGTDGPRWAWRWRCQLVLVSIASSASQIPPLLLVECAKRGVLSFRQVLHWLDHKWDEDRAQALAALAPHLQGALLGEALQIARALGNAEFRAGALATLATCIPDLDRVAVLREALEAARTGEDWNRARALIVLAPHLEGALLGEALHIVKTIGNDGARAQAMTALAPRLEGVLLGEALHIVKTIANEWTRAEALSALAPRLEGLLLGNALQIARATRIPDVRARAVALLASRLRGTERAAALNEALGAAQAIPSGYKLRRVQVLAALSPHLPEVERAAALSEALRVAKAIGVEERRIEALAALAPYLPEALFGEALRVAETIETEWRYHKAWAALAPHLPEALLGKALQIAVAMKSDWERAVCVAELAPYLSGALLHEGLEAVRAIRHEDYQAKVLIGLAPRLPGLLLTEAFRAARGIKHGRPRAEALAALALSLPQADSVAVLGEALEAARSIGDEWNCARALIAVAPHLPAAERITTLQATRAIQGMGARAWALAVLAAQLPNTDRAAALGEAQQLFRTFREEWIRIKVLTALVPSLQNTERMTVIGELLEAAARIVRKEGSWSGNLDLYEILTAVAPHLSRALLSEALRAVSTKEDVHDRDSLLATIAPRLPKALLGQALQMARAIGNASSRAKALAALASRLPELERAAAVHEALEAVRGIGGQTFGHVLATVIPYMPEADRAVGFSEALEAARAIIVRTIEQHGFGSIRSLDHRDLDWQQDQTVATLRAVLEVAAAIRHQETRCGGIGRPPVSAGNGTCRNPRVGQVEALQAEALQAAKAIQDPIRRASALAVLAPLLTGRLQEETLGAFLHSGSMLRLFFLDNSSSIFEAIAGIEGVAGAREIQRAICQTAEWFP